MTTAETIAKEIKDNRINIIDVLENLGYFQHILSGQDFVEERVNALVDCGDISILDIEKEEEIKKSIVESVMKRAKFGVLGIMNEKTDSMYEADDNTVDEEITKAINESDIYGILVNAEC